MKRGRLLRFTWIDDYRDEEAVFFAPPGMSISPLPDRPSLSTIVGIGASAAVLYPCIAQFIYPEYLPNPTLEPIAAGAVAAMAICSGTMLHRKFSKWLGYRKIRNRLWENRTPQKYVPPTIESHLDPEGISEALGLEAGNKPSQQRHGLASRLESGLATLRAHPYLTGFVASAPLWMPRFVNGLVGAASSLEGLLTGSGLAPGLVGEIVASAASPAFFALVGGAAVDYATSSMAYARAIDAVRQKIRPKTLLEVRAQSNFTTAVNALENGSVSAALSHLTRYLFDVPKLAGRHMEFLNELSVIAKERLPQYIAAFEKAKMSELVQENKDQRYKVILLAYSVLLGPEDNFEAAMRLASLAYSSGLPERTQASLSAFLAQLILIRYRRGLPSQAEGLLMRFFDDLLSQGPHVLKPYAEGKLYTIDDGIYPNMVNDHLILKKHAVPKHARAEWNLAAAAGEGIPRYKVPRILRIPPSHPSLLVMVAEPGVSLDQIAHEYRTLPKKTIREVLEALVDIHDKLPQSLCEFGPEHLGFRIHDRAISNFPGVFSTEDNRFLDETFSKWAEEFEQIRTGFFEEIPWVVFKDAALTNWRLTNSGHLLALDFEDKGITPCLYDVATLLEHDGVFYAQEKQEYLREYFELLKMKRPDFLKSYDWIDEIPPEIYQGVLVRAYEVASAHRSLEISFNWSNPTSPMHHNLENRARLYWEGRRLSRKLERDHGRRQKRKAEYFSRLVHAYELLEEAIPYPSSRVGVSRKDV